MPDLKRKGVSLVESLILIIVLLVTMGAIFATMVESQRSYAFHKQDRESREVLFAWVQAFESIWPPDDPAIPAQDREDPEYPSWEWFDEWQAYWRANWRTLLGRQVEKAGGELGEWDPVGNVARINGFVVRVEPATDLNVLNGRIDLSIDIRAGAGGRNAPSPVNILRSFNIYSSDTVSDDVLKDREI